MRPQVKLQRKIGGKKNNSGQRCDLLKVGLQSTEFAPISVSFEVFL